MSDEAQQQPAGYGTGNIPTTIIDAAWMDNENVGIWLSVTGKNQDGAIISGPLFFTETVYKGGINKGKTSEEVNLQFLKDLGMTNPHKVAEQIKGKEVIFCVSLDENGKENVDFINPKRQEASATAVSEFFAGKITPPSAGSAPTQAAATPDPKPQGQSGSTAPDSPFDVPASTEEDDPFAGL